MHVFWNSGERRLRALWRLLAQAAMMVGLAAVPIVVIAEPLTALHRRGLFLRSYDHDAYDRVINMIVGPPLTAAVVGSVVMARRWLDHGRLEDLGVRLDRSWWSGLALGLGLGTALMALVFVLEYLLGWITVTGILVSNVTGVSVAFALSFSAVKVLCVGTYEEFVSRGYQLRNLTEGLTLRWGIAISSAVFAVLHVTNDNASVLSTTGLFVNSLLLATAVLVTGRLSTAIGLHIAWNFVQGAVFGFPVSGDKEGASLVGIHQGGDAVMTGGTFGPEAGLVGILASVVGVGALFCWAHLRKGRPFQVACPGRGGDDSPGDSAMSRHERAALRASIGLAALLAVVMQVGTVASGADEGQLMQTIGTIKAVEPDAGRISVLTGCGHALRVLVFEVGAACRIEIDGVVVPLATLRPGRIVAVRYRGDVETYVAESIATVSAGDRARAK
jgi:membrane protease YdiL (CAAX protease family)